MAILHTATLTPSKLELLNAWLPTRTWHTGRGPFEHAAAYRFDDPAGEVGLEAFILTSADGTVVHVPLTYRNQPLPGGTEAFVGTMQHSVLGERWVYDGCYDPVFVAALATAIVTGGKQAELLVHSAGTVEVRQPSMTVHGTGSREVGVAVPGEMATREAGALARVEAPGLALSVVRTPGDGVDHGGGDRLIGQWPGGKATLAIAHSVS